MLFFNVATCSLLLAALAQTNAHYYIKQINGGTGALRPIALRMGGENSPVTGNQIETDDMPCNVARPFNARAPSPLKVTAGSTVTVTYDGPVFHKGPCFAYLGEGLKPPGWSKILEIYLTPKPCDQIINDNGNSLDIKIPAELAPGPYVLRVDHIGLHSAGSPGGAQFYPRCMDLDVTGSGTKKPPYEVKIPGSWTGSTPGVQWNLYYPSKDEDYPHWGGQVWNPANSPSAISAPAVPQNSGPSEGSSSENCSSRLSQCGGPNYTGPTCCATGSTCKYVNTYYSQCQ